MSGGPREKNWQETWTDDSREKVFKRPINVQKGTQSH